MSRDPAALRELVRRDWAAAARSKQRYWRAWKVRHGTAAGIRMADELRRQLAIQRPDWPSAHDRAADLAAHLEVIEALRRVPPRGR